ncbi:MAG: hydantoinase/oxoprolinase family protein [Gammaproteobacteria bacterium]|nr:hydantoinase/oxoprolinase family protein [Gammaproteobacteria bacterium]
MSYRIGTDIGGTFTDLVVSADGVLLGRYKSPTTPQHLATGVLDCLRLAAADIGAPLHELLANTEVLVHGSTVATNAVLEGKVAKCGVICTRGTRYTLWRGEGRRQRIFDFTAPPRAPLVRPHLCIELDERIDRHGQVLQPLDDEQVRAAFRQLRAQGCTAIAVCLLWSIHNPAHEQRVAELINEEWPTGTFSLSSMVQPVLREYTRMSCTVLNAMLKPVVARYLEDLERTLRDAGLAGQLLIVTSDGGVQPVAEIAARPVYMLFSGPATGPTAAKLTAAAEGREDCLLIDMGGTSFDVSTVIGGEVAVTRDGRITDHPTGVAAVQILTLGAGGGSIASVDAGGLLVVGPESAGAFPGPVCYGRGGRQPTVTDAYLALGYLSAERFLGGRMRLDECAAREAIATHIAAPLGIDVEAAALGICRVVNERMVNGILEMTVRRGIDPRQLVLVTGGGATCVAAVELARELGMRRILVPRTTSVLCAYGALNADLVWSSITSCPTRLRDFDYAGVNARLARLAEAGNAFLDGLKVPAAQRRLEVHGAARYPMQITEIDVPTAAVQLTPDHVAALAASFHDAHQARYAVAERESDVEFVMWRMVARGLTETTRQHEPKGQAGDAALGVTRFYDALAGAHREVPLVDADRLRPGDQLHGPALLVATDTTIVLPADTTLDVRGDGCLILELEEER